MDADALIAARVRVVRGERPRSDRVHVSDFGRCPRSIALRITGAPKKQESDARMKMLWLADQLHELVYESLRDAGVLVGCEVEVENLPEGISGRIDYIRREGDLLVVGDIKTTHPNRVRYPKSLPHPHAVKQVLTYRHYYGADRAELLYMDRGGENPSILVDVSDMEMDVEAEVYELLELRRKALAGEIPPLLPLEYRWIQKYSNGGGQLGFGPPWQCSYCEYECEGAKRRTTLLARIAPSYGYKWTAAGRKRLREDPWGISEFLFGKKDYAPAILRTGDSLLPDDDSADEGDPSCAKLAPIPR
jgi:hypothetical protein